MKPPIIFLIVPLLVLVGACASTDKIVLDESKREPTTSVDLYKQGETPTRKHKEIATLSFLGPPEDEFRATRFFIKEAKKLGGNGVVLDKSDAGMKGGAGAFGWSFSKNFNYKAAVVVYE